jgi:hypothetical protein
MLFLGNVKPLAAMLKIFLALQLPTVALPFSFIMLHEQPFIIAAFYFSEYLTVFSKKTSKNAFFGKC